MPAATVEVAAGLQQPDQRLLTQVLARQPMLSPRERTMDHRAVAAGELGERDTVAINHTRHEHGIAERPKQHGAVIP
ncbi:hypothetical protein OM076_28670 [Solirubrobacter ginsenosidimutans]|uniref:Uncharacterized protein n=1 Tax=Solirubrobacter ginsenosidimutans TaxID=490573 RepID=A0A9X3S8B5_9ACTN|nr:hypothetical protein [Solirubrobacter ginsenosidimutans]MDA0164278.1 hypothetical protein [Solirubrobacter ginsenosidimutans]